MPARTYTSLLNGGAAVASGLEAEIATLNAAMAGHRTELNAMPARREKLMLADDADAELDKMEMRERQLYRALEKATLQVARIENRLAEMRFAAIQPRIDHHRAQLRVASEQVEAAINAALEANQAAFAAFEIAAAEIGRDSANKLLPCVHYASFLNADGLQLWREQLRGQHERIGRQHGGTQP